MAVWPVVHIFNSVVGPHLNMDCDLDLNLDSGPTLHGACINRELTSDSLLTTEHANHTVNNPCAE